MPNKSTPWIVLTLLAALATLLGAYGTFFHSRFAMAWPIATSLLWFRTAFDLLEDES